MPKEEKARRRRLRRKLRKAQDEEGRRRVTEASISSSSTGKEVTDCRGILCFVAPPRWRITELKDGGEEVDNVAFVLGSCPLPRTETPEAAHEVDAVPMAWLATQMKR